MKRYYISALVILTISYLFSAAPIVSNILVTPETNQVSINYTLTADNQCQVILLVSPDAGVNYNHFPTTSVSGDVGNAVMPGNNQIIWKPSEDDMSVGTYKVKIIARDNPVVSLDPDHPEYLEQFESFVKVPGGTFTMGNTWDLGSSNFNSNMDLPTTHQVTLSSFYISKYEVTQAEYEAVMGTNPSKHLENGKNKPVENVSWLMAVSYCNTRSIQEGLTPCYDLSDLSCDFSANGYRLPTEAEWEYAARGANNDSDYHYSGSDILDDVAWHWDNSGDISHIVCEKAPNSLGLYDMSGNVWEWCYDWAAAYSNETQTDPTGPTSPPDDRKRINRGGSYTDKAETTDFWLVAFRNSALQDSAWDNVGFRLVRSNIDALIPQVVADPVINPTGGTYDTAQTITITCITDGASIYYTNDGSDPTESSTLYTASIELSESATIKAKAFKAACTPSNIVSEVYAINVTGTTEDLVFVESGTFDRGTVSSFYIGEHEVTQAEYQAIMGTNPSNFSGDNKPVEMVSWYDAVNYCNARSIAEGLTPCYDTSTWECDLTANGYRLPTELEWTYAAKGGNLTAFNSYNAESYPDGYRWAGTNDINELENYAWYNHNGPDGTKPVGTKLPNELGLYDMSGNVHEWTTPNPNNTWYYFMGGAWCHTSLPNIWKRIKQYASETAYDIGFRVARTRISE